MSIPSSFLSVENRNIKCLLCYHELLKGEKCQSLSEKGWKNFKEIANTWSDINIPLNDQIQNFKTESIYSPITRQNIDTGMKKLKKTPRAISVSKEDVQDCPSSQSEVAPREARWIYYGVALFRTVKPQKTYL